MDSSITEAFQPYSPPLFENYKELQTGPQATVDSLILDKTLSSLENDSSVVELSGISTTAAALQVEVDKIVAKLNELLKEDLPEGIESLNPEEYTPDATAERIVSGITALYPAYQKQNPDMTDEEALESFLELATKGIDEGYGEAVEILDGLGAFKFEGLKPAIEETRKLIEEKLASFEEMVRENFGKDDVKRAFLEQATEKLSEIPG